MHLGRLFKGRGGKSLWKSPSTQPQGAIAITFMWRNVLLWRIVTRGRNAEAGIANNQSVLHASHSDGTLFLCLASGDLTFPSLLVAAVSDFTYTTARHRVIEMQEVLLDLA